MCVWCRSKEIIYFVPQYFKVRVDVIPLLAQSDMEKLGVVYLGECVMLNLAKQSKAVFFHIKTR